MTREQMPLNDLTSIQAAFGATVLIAANDFNHLIPRRKITSPCLKEFNGTVINHDKLLLTSWSCRYLYNHDYKRVNATQRIEGCARLLFSFGERHLKVKSGKPVHCVCL